ncbi:MAG: DUF1194 domain-containing protein [Pseudomonadota bacterium]
MKWLLIAACSLIFLGQSANAACRQALALGLDVSASVDAREYRLQLDGLAAALGSAAVQDALFGQPGPPVRIAVYEWANPGEERLLTPWTEITNLNDLNQLRQILLSTSRQDDEQGSTGLGPAILFGVRLLEQQGSCWTQTLDISGDGRANIGVRPENLAGVPAWVTINGLVIGADDVRQGDDRQLQIGELVAYYASHVIRGPDAFVETALGFAQYGEAMERKLVRELAVLAIGQVSPADQFPETDVLVDVADLF